MKKKDENEGGSGGGSSGAASSFVNKNKDNLMRVAKFLAVVVIVSIIYTLFQTNA